MKEKGDGKTVATNQLIGRVTPSPDRYAYLDKLSREAALTAQEAEKNGILDTKYFQAGLPTLDEMGGGFEALFILDVE